MQTIKIGRGTENDLILQDSTNSVSREHAILKLCDNGEITLCDSSTNGTYVNGEKIVPYINVPVRKGDDVRFANTVSLDWSKIQWSDSSFGEYTILENYDERSYTIGTAADNDLIIDDPGRRVSRYHALLKMREGGKLFITDQSTNGTYVNGVKIQKEVDFPLSTADRVSFAKCAVLDWTRIPNLAASKPIEQKAPSPVNVPNQSQYSNNDESILTKIISFSISALVLGFFAWLVWWPDDKPVSNQVASAQDVTQSAPVQKVTPTPAAPASTGSDISSLYEQHKAAVFMIYTSDGESVKQGSGFFISSAGVAVSNYHVFSGTYQGLETIKTINGEYKVESVLAKDEAADYIVFRVKGNGVSFPALRIASALPKVGEDVFAIGNPEGLEHTLSKGIVSSYRDNRRIIQTTTEITHGSSGGPLFNMRGEVIGITTAGLGDANLNFAVSVVGLGMENNL